MRECEIIDLLNEISSNTNIDSKLDGINESLESICVAIEKLVDSLEGKGGVVNG